MPPLHCNRNGKSHINRATMENFSSQAFAFHRLENANSQKKKVLINPHPANSTVNMF